jgi:hypothetical protein
MIVAIVIGAVVFCAFAAFVARRCWERRHPALLRGEWWPQFERDLAGYMASRPARDRRR